MNLAKLQSNFKPNEAHLQVSALLPRLEFLVQRAKESNLLNAVDASTVRPKALKYEDGSS